MCNTLLDVQTTDGHLWKMRISVSHTLYRSDQRSTALPWGKGWEWNGNAVLWLWEKWGRQSICSSEEQRICPWWFTHHFCESILQTHNMYGLFMQGVWSAKPTTLNLKLQSPLLMGTLQVCTVQRRETEMDILRLLKVAASCDCEVSMWECVCHQWVMNGSSLGSSFHT